MGAAGGVSVVAGQPVTIEEQLSRGELVLVRTKGISMQPLLYEGQSQVIVAPAPADLALARLPDGRYLLHRVVGKDDAFYYTRGDNCCSQEAIPRQQVVGVAVEIARRGRRISMAGKIYRLYTWLWMAGYPLRRFTRRIRLRLGRRMRGKRP